MNPFEATEIMMRALSKASGLKVYANLPTDAGTPDGGEYVTCERTSGGSDVTSDNGTYAVQTWAQAEKRASEMAGQIVDACRAIMDADAFSNDDYKHICSIDVQNVYSFATDEWRRWQTVINATIQ